MPQSGEEVRSTTYEVSPITALVDLKMCQLDVSDNIYNRNSPYSSYPRDNMSLLSSYERVGCHKQPLKHTQAHHLTSAY